MLILENFVRFNQKSCCFFARIKINLKLSFAYISVIAHSDYVQLSRGYLLKFHAVLIIKEIERVEKITTSIKLILPFGAFEVHSLAEFEFILKLYQFGIESGVSLTSAQ